MCYHHSAFYLFISCKDILKDFFFFEEFRDDCFNIKVDLIIYYSTKIDLLIKFL